MDKLSLGTKINFLIKQGPVEKRVFKLFTDNRGDLFISFPYFRSTQFHAGLGYFPLGSTKRQLNPIIEGTQSPIPLKLSYHQDGQIHFKPISPSQLDLSPGYKNAELKATPFTELRSQHILTVEIEGLEKYQDFVPSKVSELYRGFVVGPDAKRFKFVFYGGMTKADMKGTFQSCKFFEISRPSPPNPFVVGLSFKPFRNSLHKTDPKPSLICLAGFSREDTDISREAHYLYLMAR
jgi:hypothetical protein